MVSFLSTLLSFRTRKRTCFSLGLKTSGGILVVLILLVVTSVFTGFQGRDASRVQFIRMSEIKRDKAEGIRTSFDDKEHSAVRQGIHGTLADTLPGSGHRPITHSRVEQVGSKSDDSTQIRVPQVREGIGNEPVQKLKAFDAGNRTALGNPPEHTGATGGSVSSQSGMMTAANEVSPEPVSNGSEIARKFHCPSAFAIKDPNNAWFTSSIVQKSPKYNKTLEDSDEVLILTPISNSKRHLMKYFQNICSLTFPHDRISIVLGEDSSSDQSFEEAQRLADEVRSYFRRVEVLQLKGRLARTSHSKHDMAWQLERRRHLSMVRNQLLFSALRKEKWVVWIDSDVRHLPTDLLERLLWPQKEVVAANCLYRPNDFDTDTFDRNTWRETETSKRYLDKMPAEFLMLEGYSPSQRKFLNDLKGEGDVVRLDGVGGCVLLVEGDLHRKGLVFPPFVFDHHIESEGFAKMAARMGVQIYGMPSVNVIHW